MLICSVTGGYLYNYTNLSHAPLLIERIRVAIFDEGEVEIVVTEQELSERFGYEESAQFSRDVGTIEDTLMEFGIDIERNLTNRKRHIRIYENKESGYHPIQQAHPIYGNSSECRNPQPKV